MKATTLRYAAVHNLGQYENERIELEIALEPDEAPAEALRRARRFVKAAFQSDWRSAVDPDGAPQRGES